MRVYVSEVQILSVLSSRTAVLTFRNSDFRSRYTADAVERIQSAEHFGNVRNCFVCGDFNRILCFQTPTKMEKNDPIFSNAKITIYFGLGRN